VGVEYDIEARISFITSTNVFIPRFTPTPGRHVHEPVEGWYTTPTGMPGSRAPHTKSLVRRHGRQPVVRGFTAERSLFRTGCGIIAGLDEAGRGAWAGPLTAGALLITPDDLSVCQRLRQYVRDSKTLNANQRERAFAVITAQLDWSVGIVTHAELDQHGVRWANQIAFDRAVAALSQTPDFLLIDGRGFSFPHPHRNIIDGDALVFSIAAASILAKVTRDRMMVEFDQKFPDYGFSSHKGYGTLQHIRALEALGPCSIHRRSYRPIRNITDKQHRRHEIHPECFSEPG